MKRKKDVATVAPTGCPACGSTKREKVEGTRKIYGPFVVGHVNYDYMVVGYTICKTCGKRYVLRTFHRDPGG